MQASTLEGRSQISPTYAQLASNIARGMQKADTLGDRLGVIVETIAAIPGLEGVLLVACDEDDAPLWYESSGILLPEERRYERFLDLKKSLEDRDSWIPGAGGLIDLPDPGAEYSRQISSSAQTCGLFVVWLAPDGTPGELLGYVDALLGGWCETAC